jgi:hypothetical protein
MASKLAVSSSIKIIDIFLINIRAIAISYCCPLDKGKTEFILMLGTVAPAKEIP